MLGQSQRHAAVLQELTEWWEDLTRDRIGSEAVIVPVPSRWGRTTLLHHLAAKMQDDDVNPCVVVDIDALALPDQPSLQAQALRDAFGNASASRHIAKLLGADRLGGTVQLSLGIAGLFVSPMTGGLTLLIASLAVNAAGRMWDDTPAGQQGAVARTARAVAAFSVSQPVVVLIDNADRMSPALAATLVDNLIERPDGQVLVVATASPDSDLTVTLTSPGSYRSAMGRVYRADADPDMNYHARAGLAAELLPYLPPVAARRIGHRTGTFADVFRVARAEILADSDHVDDATALARVDDAIDAKVEAKRTEPSAEAVLLAWAGGPVHATQAEQALIATEARRADHDDDVVRFDSLVRLADPASPRLARQVKILGASKRRQLAAALLDAAISLAANPEANQVETVVACWAVHRVRGDIDDDERLLPLQCRLVHGLEALGDTAAASEVASDALAGHGTRTGERFHKDLETLTAAMLRLRRTGGTAPDDPVIENAAAIARQGGAAIGLEARIWAAVDLLGEPGQRDVALNLADQVAVELESRTDLGSLGSEWRLLLAFHAGQAGYLAVTQRLLAPTLAADHSAERDAAQAVLFAVAGAHADTRLQIAVLEAELTAAPEHADDDRLRLHSALSHAYARLGYYDRALSHGQQELPLRIRLQGQDHRATLTTRLEIAKWVGECGNHAEELRLLKELLPDIERVLGRDRPLALAARANIAAATGYCEGPAAAVRMFRDLLPAMRRILGPRQPETLIATGNLAALAIECGLPELSLRIVNEVLPDMNDVLGHDHSSTLAARYSLASSTGHCGQPAEALRLFKDLLPDRERVLGSDHPAALRTRLSIATLTKACGNPAEALRLLNDLLPHQMRVLGPNHPDTLVTQSQIRSI